MRPGGKLRKVELFADTLDKSCSTRYAYGKISILRKTRLAMLSRYDLLLEYPYEVDRRFSYRYTSWQRRRPVMRCWPTIVAISTLLVCIATTAGATARVSLLER